MTATLVLHLGPHKTATTFLQHTLEAAEAELAAEQVHYAVTGRSGSAHHDMAFALWAPERRSNLMAAGRTMPSWTDLRTEAELLPDGARLVVSTENFAHVRDGEIEGVRALGGGVKVELVVGLRRLDALLPSLWQEGVKWGRQWSFAEAVTQLLEEDRVRLLPMLDRWIPATNPEAVHAVAVPSGGDSERLLTSFASAVGCERQTLASAAPAEALNESISWVHAEVLRRVSSTIDPAGDQSSLLRRQQVLHQLIPLAPPVSDPARRPAVPAELHQSLVDLHAEVHAGLVDRGVTVHGELPALGGEAQTDSDPPSEPHASDVVDAAAWMLEQGSSLSPEARDAVDTTGLRLDPPTPRQRAGKRLSKWLPRSSVTRSGPGSSR